MSPRRATVLALQAAATMSMRFVVLEASGGEMSVVPPAVSSPAWRTHT